MKIQKTLMIAGLAMSLAMTACDSSSNAAFPEVQVTPRTETENFEVAQNIQEQLVAAQDMISSATIQLKDSQEARDAVQVAFDAESNPVLKEEIAKSLEAKVAEVKVAEERLKLANEVMTYRRELFGKQLSTLSEDDIKALGDTGTESQEEYEAKREKKFERIELKIKAAHGATVENVELQADKVSELTIRLKNIEEDILRQEGSASAEFIAELIEKRANAEKDLKEASAQLAAAMAVQDALLEATEGI